MHDDYKPTVTDWIAMLSISTRLNFPKVRERAIKEITARLEEIDPFDLIGLAVKYDVQQWLMPAYRRIVTRNQPYHPCRGSKDPVPDGCDAHALARAALEGQSLCTPLFPP
jgi:hypothetical protein